MFLIVDDLFIQGLKFYSYTSHFFKKTVESLIRNSFFHCVDQVSVDIEGAEDAFDDCFVPVSLKLNTGDEPENDHQNTKCTAKMSYSIWSWSKWNFINLYLILVSINSYFAVGGVFSSKPDIIKIVIQIIFCLLLSLVQFLKTFLYGRLNRYKLKIDFYIGNDSLVIWSHYFYIVGVYFGILYLPSAIISNGWKPVVIMKADIFLFSKVWVGVIQFQWQISLTRCWIFQIFLKELIHFSLRFFIQIIIWWFWFAKLTTF